MEVERLGFVVGGRRSQLREKGRGGKHLIELFPPLFPRSEWRHLAFWLVREGLDLMKEGKEEKILLTCFLLCLLDVSGNIRPFHWL